jgi:hypothetical protein
MSTTVVAQLTGEPGIDMYYQSFVAVTVKENDISNEAINKATMRVSQDAVVGGDEIDMVELRASLASELRVEDLTLERLEIVRYVFLGE